MDWIEVSVHTNTLGADMVSEALMRAGAKGTQIIDRADVPDADKPSGYWELIDPALVSSLPEDTLVKAWFSSAEDMLQAKAALALLPEAAGFDIGTLALDSQAVKEEDWAECWKQYYKPLRAGKRLVVKPSWESYAAQRGDLVIELDPGMAFGTGTHETTALCLELIERHFGGGTLLDVGSGSGILAIAAGLLGAQRVVAVDIDPLAVRVAQENVRKNNLQDIVQVRQGDLVAGLGETFDFACANILADVIIMLAAPLKKHLKPGAGVVFCGIIKEREADVMAALQPLGYTVVERAWRGEWSALFATAPQ